jgi:nicotinate-nucleotide pyrophosphorylase (carboxylating)
MTGPTAPEYGPSEELAAAELIRLAWDEDLGEQIQHGQPGDLTANSLIDQAAHGQVDIRSRNGGVVCGLPLVAQLFIDLDPLVQIQLHVNDGQRVDEPTCLATLAGPVRSLLAGERTALNFLGYLSGIATQTDRHLATIANTNNIPQLLDTRKTLPGYRRLAKYAVACGGGTNHRMGLYDAVLIKDNHLASRGNPLEVGSAITAARAAVGNDVTVQAEIDSLEQLAPALDARPDILLLDNMTTEELVLAVTIRNKTAPDVLLEASGGINLESLAAVAATQVDRISVGALTHSVPNWDVAFDWVD